jgi:hypothetical protein
MKVVGLDGQLYSWNPVGRPSADRECSSYHMQARTLLKSLFPSEKLLEEVGLPGTRPILYADFFVPLRKLIVEVHGEQHYVWTPHFHPTKRDFIEGRKCDTKKRNWCQLNQLDYIELPYKETIDEWRSRILSFGASEV